MLAPKSSVGLPELVGQIGRFLVVGLANTAVTGAVFYGLSFVLPSSVAYTIAFGLGIGFVVGVTPRFVFSARPPVSRRAAYAGWYLIVYLIGLGVVQVLDSVLVADHLVVVILTLATTATLGYLGGRVILTGAAPRGKR
jgi:putative flippase GtrA